ncbi:phage protein NinX family protein [Morganella morganii]|uniref:phage protein NinX family protein n=1 Tax=Morganella morganii TaxID=582 RepID=UPI0028084A62|nr:DUF2591 family protein [Morganella morganii subsp. sibonii]HDU8307937.1 DUF2591 family protein [Morganella morganii subsp. sibonii]
MNKYSDKSDFEINLCVAQIIFTDSEYDVIKQSMEVVKFQNGNGKGTCHAFDPCNNPADAMPIIIENGISSLFSDDEWICSVPYTGFLSINENLYRAAMEVFLMMKDAENES